MDKEGMLLTTVLKHLAFRFNSVRAMNTASEGCFIYVDYSNTIILYDAWKKQLSVTNQDAGNVIHIDPHDPALLDKIIKIILGKYHVD